MVLNLSHFNLIFEVDRLTHCWRFRHVSRTWPGCKKGMGGRSFGLCWEVGRHPVFLTMPLCSCINFVGTTEVSKVKKTSQIHLALSNLVEPPRSLFSGPLGYLGWYCGPGLPQHNVSLRSWLRYGANIQQDMTMSWAFWLPGHWLQTILAASFVLFQTSHYVLMRVDVCSGHYVTYFWLKP